MADGFDEVSDPAGRTVQVLHQLVAEAAAALKCPSAVLMLNLAGKTRVIADVGVPRRYRSFDFDLNKAPYRRDERLVVPDTANRPELQGIGTALGLPHTGFFARLPIERTEDLTLSLLVYGDKPGRKPGKAAVDRLATLEALIRDEFRPVRTTFTDPDNHVTHAITVAHLATLADDCPLAAALVAQDLTLRAVNSQMATVLGKPASELLGGRLADLPLPARDAVLLFLTRALETRTSPPELEIVAGEGSNQRVYSISISPFSPVGSMDYFALVTARDVTILDQREHGLGKGRQRPQLPPDPTQAFLLETLVPRRTIRERKAVSYVTLRGWRKPVKAYQLKALKALKAKVPKEFAKQVASEVVREVQALVGQSAFVGVVPMPCGHSDEASCLSLEIARATASSLGVPCIPCLSIAKQKGSSHPRKNPARPRMQLGETVAGPLLLVDDVATSGAHIEEAVFLLRQKAGSVLAVAWIGGDRT